MKYIFIDDINLLSKFETLKLKKSFFITNNPAVYKFLKIKKIKVILISEIIKSNQLIKLQSEYYKKFIKLLLDLDKNKNILFKTNKDIFYNSFRYVYAINYSGILTCAEGLNMISRKKKIKTLFIFGEISSDIFDRTFLINELETKNPKLKIKNIYNLVQTKKKFLRNLNFRNLNSLNLDILINQFRKEVSKRLFFSHEKKNLIIEPLWDLFYYKYDFKKNLIINLSDILKNYPLENNKKNLSQIPDSVFEKYNKNFSKKLIKYLINEAHRVNQKSNFIINKVNRLLQKFNFKKIIWCNDPDSYTANVLSYFKRKKVQIIGIQHGGGYLLQNYGPHHVHSDFNFCDKFLSYGASKYLIDKKVLVTGCLRDPFYKNNLNNKSPPKNHYDFMYVPNPILSEYFYTLNKSSYEKLILQDKIVNFLKNNKAKTIIKLPQSPSLSHYPLLIDKKMISNFLLRYEKIYKSIEINKPKIIILDYFSTSIYECLYSKSEIILFLDKYNMPKSDVIKSLKKRVHIIYKFSELSILVKKILQNKISKKNEEFKKKFFSIKSKKMIRELLN